MKSLLSAISLIFILASCQNKPEGEAAATGEKQAASNATGGQAYHVDASNSTVLFIGTKPIGTHHGLMHLKEGTLNVDKGNIVSGSFLIDMSKIEIKDADTTYSFKLVGHLLSPDFFNAAKYPTAKFEITKCEALQNDSTATHRISGNLTIKDSTKNISFPAKINLTDNTMSATADFNIERTLWGLHYGNDKSLGDKFIYPEVKIQLNIQAKK